MDPGTPKLAEGSQPAESRSSGEAATAGFSVVTPGLQVKREFHERKFSYWALLVLTAGALYLAYIIYRPFLKVLFLALVLTHRILAVGQMDRPARTQQHGESAHHNSFGRVCVGHLR
jgi:hypothetical protein